MNPIAIGIKSTDRESSYVFLVHLGLIAGLILSCSVSYAGTPTYNLKKCAELLSSAGFEVSTSPSEKIEDRVMESLIAQLGMYNYRNDRETRSQVVVPYTAQEIKTNDRMKKIADAHIHPWFTRLQRLAKFNGSALDRFKAAAGEYGLENSKEILMALELRHLVEEAINQDQRDSAALEIKKRDVLRILGDRNIEAVKSEFAAFLGELNYPSITGFMSTSKRGNIPNPLSENASSSILIMEERYPHVHLLLLFLAGEPLPENKDFSSFAKTIIEKMLDSFDANANSFAGSMLTMIQGRIDQYDYEEARLLYPLWNVWTSADLQKFINREPPFRFDTSHPYPEPE